MLHQARTWGSFTFHPTLLWRALWEEHGPYVRFTSEGKLSRHLKRLGRHTAYLDPGVGHHIGVQHSVFKRPFFHQLRLATWKRYYKWIAPKPVHLEPARATDASRG